MVMGLQNKQACEVYETPFLSLLQKIWSGGHFFMWVADEVKEWYGLYAVVIQIAEIVFQVMMLLSSVQIS